MANIVLPERFEILLLKNQKLDGIVKTVLYEYGDILTENKLFFFEEYTDHGVKHIENVIFGADKLIPNTTFENILEVKDLGFFLLAVILHDIGMHITFDGFSVLLSGDHDDILIESFDSKTWQVLWKEYLSEAKRFNGKQLVSIFGDEEVIIQNPMTLSKGELTGNHRKLIGEFIRRYHARLAHEIALVGFPGSNGKGSVLFADEMDIKQRNLIGLIARSHGMNLRKCVEYLEKEYGNTKRTPLGVHVSYHMILLRLADYMQIDRSRTSEVVLKTKSFESPISSAEHAAHLTIEHIDDRYQDDPERIFVDASPGDSKMYLKLKKLFNSIQGEFDTSWAVLGELYGTLEDKPAIQFRRISSNLDDNAFIRKQEYVGDYFTFKANDDIIKLLISPLYGDDPKYGVRELLQNSLDACEERKILECQNEDYLSKVEIDIYQDEANFFFQISDNGKGMNIDEIKNYFLSAGASYRKSLRWKEKFLNDEGDSKVQRNGRFGIGVLAAFLIGDFLEVETKSFGEVEGYTFNASLNSDQVNVLKNLDIDIGTTIRIQIDENKFKFFKKLKRKYESKRIWTEWYTLKEPKVVYKINNTVLAKPYKVYDPHYKDEFIPNDWNSIDYPGFNKILWTYSYGYTNNKIVCNGIIIPHDGYSRQSGILDMRLIYNRPNLSIFDNNGLTPISLDRNELTGELPFSKELVEDIYKDLIAYFLTYNEVSSVQDKKIVIRNQSLNHSAVRSGYYSTKLNEMRGGYGTGIYRRHQDVLLKELFISKNGFILNNSYFINRIPKSDLIFIKSNHFDLLDSINLDLKENYLLISDDKSGSIDHYKTLIIEDSYTIDSTMNRSTFYMKKKKYDFLFKGGKKRMPSWLKSSLKKNYIHGSWISLELTDIKNRIITKKFLTENHDIVDFIRESPLRCKSNGDELFNKLLKRFIGDDVVIPFEIEARKEKFPLAFKELEKYMEKYLLV